ncbi:heterokaryon incompatibility protein-domain-containing protein [Sordaria brevicollis]|uniref:Heterokaryon incompatibility protein-domain-containing protein n=1 Tax=Sordaria brevicollis TaxID=83679 RepID=A0AAE0PLU1_SORBR|nr:heterokaryon incompatibility protein-domain-containing protein [Sordaria brevicollis]
MSLDDNAQTAMVYTESLPFSTEPSKVMAETLCEYCAAIDFEQLRLSSSKDVQELNEGNPIEPQLPFIQYQVQRDDRPHWSLGSQSRIESSAATCPFCREVCRVLEVAEVREKVPDVFENDPICDVYFTLAGFIEAPPGVTWSRYQSSEKLLRQVAKSFHKKVHHLLSLRAQMLNFSDPNVIPHPRISLRWTVPEKHEMRWFQRYPISQGVIELFECFQSMDPVSKESKGLFTGVERPALIDMELPRRWLRSCLENDGGPCVPKPSGRKIIVPIFRLIDTKSNALVEFKDQNLDKIQYVTLSYVWGTTQQVMLKRENLLQLQLPGSLHGTTPKTITDAMIFTSRMGYRYIWVDVFCIIQDDNKDKATQLQRMGDIYKNSVFTIVAAAGGHSDAGLYGVRTPRKAMQRKVQVKSASPTQAPLWLMSTVMPLTGYFDPYTHGLPWQTRGWTLQERALSRRVFTFTGEQLLWSCRQCQRWEETETETSLASITFRNMEDANVTLDGPLRFDQSRESSMRDVQAKFWKLVYDFSNRNLCFEGDAHDAFSAILREYTELTGEQFVWGMPVSEGHFGSALCWEPTSTIFPRRKELTTLPTTSLNTKVPFPSWSWLGWKGKIRPFVAQPG